MGRPSSTTYNNSPRWSEVTTTRKKSSDVRSFDAESVIRNERVYLHILDYEAREFTGLTTYHGMVRIYNSNTWPSRIFWCVVVVSCVSMFMIHCGIMLYGYHRKPTLTQVNVIIPPEGIVFPEITICALNPVIEDKVKNWNMSKSVLNYLLKSFDGESSDREKVLLDQHSDLLRYLNEYKNSTGKNFKLLEFIDSTSPSCTDLIKSCFWAGERILNCCAFSKEIYTEYGKCYTFSNKKLQRKQWFSGYNYGYEIIVDTKSDRLFEHLSIDPFADIGIRIFIHNETQFPQMIGGGILAPPGMRMYAGMEKKELKLLPNTDWGVCQQSWDEKIHGKQLLNFSYSANHCEMNCRLNFFVENCNCAPVYLNFNKTFQTCDPIQLTTCEIKVNKTFQSETCNCAVECEKSEYDIQISYSNMMFTLEDREMMKLEGQSLEYAKENYVSVMIYMREISYELHEQQRQMQTADLLSNIGGSMGLFLGMSTVTMLEVFIFLFKSVWGTINKDRQKQFVKSVIEQDEQDQQNVVLVQEEEDNFDENDEIEEEEIITADESNIEEGQPFIRRPSTLFKRRQSNRPRKSYSIIFDDRRRISQTINIRSSLSDAIHTARKESATKPTLPTLPTHSATLDLPNVGPARRLSNQRLSVFYDPNIRRQSKTELFRQARRPSAQFLGGHPAISVLRRPSHQSNHGDEIHLHVDKRKLSVSPGNAMGRRKSTAYTNSLL
uniref:Uncharacterized protein n=1 Tax=Panagrolaimus sp. PS1159 TaxID=55785 RepID=A0AC35GSI0_9BILA